MSLESFKQRAWELMGLSPVKSPSSTDDGDADAAAAAAAGDGSRASSSATHKDAARGFLRVLSGLVVEADADGIEQLMVSDKRKQIDHGNLGGGGGGGGEGEKRRAAGAATASSDAR